MAEAYPPVFLRAEWRDLAMLNYEVDPDVLRSRVPAGTELDAWNGRTFVSIVGFRFLNTKVRGVPIPFHRNFEELNLRFYVRRRSGSEWRRGVVFIKEVVPRRAIAWTARALYNENYFAHRMRHAIVSNGGDCSGHVAYEWRYGGRWQGLRLEHSGKPFVPDEASEECFITEHYWGYARQRDGGTVEYRVEHPRWSVLRVESATLDCDVASFYGSEMTPFLSAAPSSAFLADGSAITVGKGVRL